MTLRRSPVALVTGGGRGIGAGVVRGLSVRGYAVAIHCHASLREARGLAAEIEAVGGQAFAVTANFREEGAVRAMMHRVLDHFGRLDVVAACARLWRPTNLEAVSTADLVAHYEVNVLGTFIVVQEALPVMRAQPEGGIIVAHVTTHEPEPSDVAFATSQAALPGFMKSLAAELAATHPKIQAAALSCGDDQATTAILAQIDERARQR